MCAKRHTIPRASLASLVSVGRPSVSSRAVCAAAVGRLCEKCDGKCPVCDSYVRPCVLVRICDECNYGSYQGRCVICGAPGISDAYYCKECTQQEKDVSGAPRPCPASAPHAVAHHIQPESTAPRRVPRHPPCHAASRLLPRAGAHLRVAAACCSATAVRKSSISGRLRRTSSTSVKSMASARGNGGSARGWRREGTSAPGSQSRLSTPHPGSPGSDRVSTVRPQPRGRPRS